MKKYSLAYIGFLLVFLTGCESKNWGDTKFDFGMIPQKTVTPERAKDLQLPRFARAALVISKNDIYVSNIQKDGLRVKPCHSLAYSTKGSHNNH